ncbi:hypothetical protein ACPA0F_03195 [Solibacillus silvestris]
MKIVFRENSILKATKKKFTPLRFNATIYIFKNYLKDIKSFRGDFSGLMWKGLKWLVPEGTEAGRWRETF